MSFSLLPFSNNSVPTIFCNCIILQQIRNLKIKNWFFITSVLRHRASDHGPHWLKPMAEEGLLSSLSLGPSHCYLFSYLYLLLFGRTWHCLLFLFGFLIFLFSSKTGCFNGWKLIPVWARTGRREGKGRVQREFGWEGKVWLGRRC